MIFAFLPFIFGASVIIVIAIVSIKNSSRAKKNQTGSSHPKNDNLVDNRASKTGKPLKTRTEGVHQHEFDKDRIKRLYSLCPYCHKSLEPKNVLSYRRCPSCGEPFDNYCHTCGSLNVSSAILCQECYTPLEKSKTGKKKKEKTEPLEW